MGRECKPREVNDSGPQAPSNLHEFIWGVTLRIRVNVDPMGVPFIGVSPDAARFCPCEPFFLFLCGNTWYFGRLRRTHCIVLLGSLDTITTATKRFPKILGNLLVTVGMASKLYLTTQYNGLLFGFVNGQNTTYSHIKIGKMVHKDKNEQHPVTRL